MKTVNLTLTVASRVTLVSLALVVAGCSSSSSEAPASSTAERATVLSKTEEAPLPPASSPYDALPAEARGLLDRPFTGDADEMVKRRLIRAGVVYNRTQYFIDHGVQRGNSYEALRMFEDELNKRLKTGLLKVHVAIMPRARDQLFPALVAGKDDLIAAALTITPERRKLADFSNPTRMGVSEIVVTSAPGGKVASTLYPTRPGRFVLVDNLRLFMNAEVLVLKYATVAVTGIDGRYRIVGLPPGKLKVSALLPATGSGAERAITVEGGKTTTVDFEIPFDEKAYRRAAEARSKGTPDAGAGADAGKAPAPKAKGNAPANPPSAKP